MELSVVALLSLFVLGFGLVSRHFEASWITPPMVFVGFGMLVSPEALGWLRLEVDSGGVHLLAEMTLVLVLFSDAARIDLRALRREAGLPVRLLAIGMPLTILAGAGAAWLFLPELAPWEAVVLAAVLAPTDAALGQAVVASKRVPLRIRQALNVESGLNDGIALPIVMITAACAGTVLSHGEAAPDGGWLRYTLLQVTLGPAVGVLVGGLGGWLAAGAVARASMSESFERLAGLALALLAFAGAEAIGGNGFISAFVAGLTLGNTARDFCGCVYSFLETEGQLMMLLVFLLLGSTLAWPAIESASPALWLHALASLTLVRMLPVAISMIGTGLRPSSVTFLGWFGPRGLASILFGILVLTEAGLTHGEELFTAVVITVLLSVVAHGITAAAGARAYGRALAARTTAPEHDDVTPHPLRCRVADEGP